MSIRQVLLYFAWSRPAEIGAPLTDISDRFPALFELRRLRYPHFEALADDPDVDQGIGGFLDHVQRRNFTEFAEQAERQTGRPVIQIERVADNGDVTPLDAALIANADTIVVIGFDSDRTRQLPASSEIEAIRRFLDIPGNLAFFCPHHEIGCSGGVSAEDRVTRQVAEHLHHGDPSIPPRQGFGGYVRSLLEALHVPVENRFGLRPAADVDGSPSAIDVEKEKDSLGLLAGVQTLNLHPHLPHFVPVGVGADRMEVIARQRLDRSAPPHPLFEPERLDFDSLVQSRPEAFAGRLLVGDATLFSSTAGGLESLRRFWSNILDRPKTSVRPESGPGLPHA